MNDRTSKQISRLDLFRSDVAAADRGLYADRVVLTAYSAKLLLAEIDARIRRECQCGCYSGGCGRPDGCQCDKTCPCGAAEPLKKVETQPVALKTMVQRLEALKNPNWTHYNDGWNQALNKAIELIRQDETTAPQTRSEESPNATDERVGKS